MKQKLRLFLSMLLVAVCGMTWGAEDTYTFTDKSWKATLNGVRADWTSLKDGNQYTANQGIQITTGNTGAGATSPVSFNNISSIVVTYCTNSSRGEGTINVEVGDGTKKTFAVTKPSSGGTTLKTTEFVFDSAETGNVTLTVDCTTNSVYIYSIAITYNPGEQTELTDPDVSFKEEEITVLVGGTGTNTLNKPNDLTGITFSSRDTNVATVDADGTVHGRAVGNTTITASWDETDKYNEGSESFEVEVVATIDPVVIFELSTYTLPVGGSGINTLTKPNDLTGITFSSINPNVATVNATTGEVTAIAEGSTTITASWNAIGTYNAGTVFYTVNVTGSSMILDFEQEASGYPDWNFNNAETHYTNSEVTPHDGSFMGSTGGKTAASITTKSKIAYPKALTCYVSKETKNTTSSTWYIQVSTDGTTWTNVASRSATDMSKGEWKEFSADLSSYSDVYVRVYYSGSTAVRNIDDITLEVETAQQPWINISPESIDAVEVYAGDEITKTFTVSFGNLSSDINVDTNFGTVSPNTIVKNGSEATVTWIYTPTEAGDFGVTITLASEDDNLEKTISFNVTALGATIILSKTEIDAGDVFIGNVVTETFTVNSHNLTGDMTVTATAGTVNPTAIGKEAGETTVTWTYTPTEGGEFDATITVASAADHVEKSINISGTAITSTETVALPFIETFRNCEGNGGNDNKWNGQLTQLEIDPYRFDNNEYEWDYEKTYEADQCVKIGASNYSGYLRTPFLSLESGNTYILTFKAGAWDASGESTRLGLSISSGTLSQTAVTMKKGEWSDYIITIYADGPAAITFSSTGKNRFFLDEINVTDHYTVNIVDIGYATYVAEGNFVVGADLEVYTAQDKGTEVDLTQLEVGTIVNSGTPVVLKGNNGTYTLEPAAEAGEPLANNDLIAATEEVVGDGTIYVLNSVNGEVGFYRLSSGSTLEAGKAYLKSEDNSQNVKFFGQGDDTPTGISSVERENVITSDSVIYNMAGQRVAAPTKGIYIINGKKVILK